MIELNKIYNEDCLETMRRMGEGFIDLTVTSPPYDSLRTYGNDIDKTWNESVWKPIIKELYRVTKEGGVVVWVVGDATIKGSETGTSFKQALYFMEVGFNLHDTMIYYCNKPPLTHNRYEQEFEYMFVFTKGKLITFNPIKKENKYFGKNSIRNGSWASGKDNSAMRQREGKKLVNKLGIKGNVWRYETGGGKSTLDKIAFQHPAIFPEALANDHIISWSNEGDLVYDPFCGSGTTPKMAEQSNRYYIGSEVSKDYIDITKQRLHPENIFLDKDDWVG